MDYKSMALNIGLPLQFAVKEYRMFDVFSKLLARGWNFPLVGGTAINKVYLAGEERFSEDLDFEVYGKQKLKVPELEGYKIKGPYVYRRNIRFEAEYTEYMQYSHDATKTLDKELAAELISNANDELEHVKELTKLMISRGGKPSIDIQKIDTQETKNIWFTQTPTTEEAAVADYKELIAMAQKLNDTEAQKVLQSILTKEEKHLGAEQSPIQLYDWD